MRHRRDFRLLNSVETVKDYGAFEFGSNAFCIMIWLQVYEDQGEGCGSQNKNGQCRLTYLHFGYSVGGNSRDRLGRVDLLEEVFTKGWLLGFRRFVPFSELSLSVS